VPPFESSQWDLVTGGQDDPRILVAVAPAAVRGNGEPVAQCKLDPPAGTNAILQTNENCARALSGEQSNEDGTASTFDALSCQGNAHPASMIRHVAIIAPPWLAAVVMIAGLPLCRYMCSVGSAGQGRM
jgi:hypothetical protein